MLKLCALLLLLSLVVGCTTQTYVEGYGHQPCVGLGETHDPRFTYKLSWWNLTLAIFLVELVVPTVVIVADYLVCPAHERPHPEKETSCLPSPSLSIVSHSLCSR
jgi:hypothetical protein